MGLAYKQQQQQAHDRLVGDVSATPHKHEPEGQEERLDIQPDDDSAVQHMTDDQDDPIDQVMFYLYSDTRRNTTILPT